MNLAYRGYLGIEYHTLILTSFLEFFMSIKSKYKNQDIEVILDEINAVLDKHNADAQLSLIITGNLITYILNNRIPTEMRQSLANTFTHALLSSIDNN